MPTKNPMPSFQTIDDYIAHQSQEAQPILQELRNIINEAAPDAEEILNYKIPSFRLVKDGKRDQQIMMAAYAKFVSFYPFPTTIEAFSDELKSYKTGKGSVQFPLDKDLPKDLIVRMIKFRQAELKKDT